MKSLSALWLGVMTLTSITCQGHSYDFEATIVRLKEAIRKASGEASGLKNVVRDLTKQAMLQQFYVENKIRNDGNSGIRLIRGNNKGLQNYISASFLRGSNVFSIHDHSNYDRTIGLGELVPVLNGVEFQTRHNDYKLVMPAKDSSDYHATESIPFPGVPPQVTQHTDVQDQIDEMREWFKAFHTQNITHRDYRQFFKPVLCYLEGAWTVDQNLVEPFQSDRHSLDARTLFELQEKVAFAAYSGIKSALENLAYLPTKIMSVNTETDMPNLAQWNYRILCHPTNRDIPFKYLYQADDLKVRVPYGRDMEDIAHSRAARYKIYDPKRRGRDQLIDDLMNEIPGKDNKPDNLQQNVLGVDQMYKVGPETLELLDGGRYHRSYKMGKKDAMGLSVVSRGFNDDNLFVAQTTQKRVAAMPLTTCNKRGSMCQSVENRFSYAIPLELIYLTPLLSWNPFGLIRHEKKNTIVTANGRNGRSGANKAFNGTDFSHHFLTPVQFFTDPARDGDPADTVPRSVHVLDSQGKVRETTASGTWIFLPNIEGIGRVRLRYPVAPVHDEGASVWHELNALKDMLKPRTEPTNYIFTMLTAQKASPGPHVHELELTSGQFRTLINGGSAVVTSSEAFGHTHELGLKYRSETKTFEYISCGGKEGLCWDKHPKYVTLLTETALI